MPDHCFEATQQRGKEWQSLGGTGHKLVITEVTEGSFRCCLLCCIFAIFYNKTLKKFLR